MRSHALLILSLLLTFPAVYSIAAQQAAAQGVLRRVDRTRERVRRGRQTVKKVTGANSADDTAAGERTGEDDAARNPLRGSATQGPEREIAERFAPIIHQGLGSSPRYDYITNFDFDNDWRGDNNWANAANPRFALRAYVYYSVSETPTHYFVHYAAFHPRDYKGGKIRGRLVSRGIRAGVNRAGQFDPTGRADEAVLAHENDLEGCLVVAEKRGDDLRQARVVYVETLAHNRFHKYVTIHAPSRQGFVRASLLGQRPRIYVEPRGHGILAYNSQRTSGGILVYSFVGRAEAPKSGTRRAGYDLVPLGANLWPRARGGTNETYGEAHDYGTQILETPGGRREVRLGQMGAAFNGLVGGRHMARPPWGWFDGTERDRPLGEWFLDPAGTVKRHFQLGDDFSITYTKHPILGL